MPTLKFFRKDGSEIPHPEETISLLTDALRSIKARASDCERINLAGKSPAAKTAATLRNIITICDEALETKQ